MLDFVKIKKYLIYALVGCLIVSALIAVYAVLFKSFNEITGRIFWTLFIAFAHSLVSLLFLWNDEKTKSFNKLPFVINTIFLIVILSFVTDIFGIWKIIEGETVAKLYLTFITLFFSSLHADILSKASGREKYIDNIVYANYIFIALIVLMLQPLIYIHNPTKVLGEFYYRILGACGIIDATLSILTIIFYRLYMHKHPELKNPAIEEGEQKHRKGLSIWVWLLIIFIGLPMLYSVVSAIAMSLFLNR